MITFEQLDEISKKWKIDRFTVLREYLQVLFLSNLYSLKESNSIYFKGGTAIKLLYNSYRFSEDLDFTTTSEPDRAKQLLLTAQENSATEVEGIGINSWDVKPYAVTARLKYKSAIAPQPLTVHLEVSLREKPLTQTVVQLESLFPINPYPLVVAMRAEELLAEKVRALLTRQKGRDLFDIWFLLSKGIVLNNEMIQQKMDYYKRKYSFEELKRTIADFPARDLKNDINKFVPSSHRKIIDSLPEMALGHLLKTK